MSEVLVAGAFAPHITAAVAATLALLLDGFGGRRTAVVVAAAGTVAASAVAWVASGRAPQISGNVVLSGAGFSAVVAVVFAIGAVVLAGSYRRLASDAHGGGLAALGVFATSAAAGVAVAADILVMLLCLEGLAMCAYVLVWSARTRASAEASMKYFVQGAVATGLFVLGLAIVFGLYGTSTSYMWVRGGVGDPNAPAVTAAFALMAAALAYKLGAFPFHSWALDAFENAPPHVSALLAGMPKVAAFVALMVLFTGAFFPGVESRTLLWVFSMLAVGSMVFGVFGGLVQRSYTRMLAYSGIAQVGYVLVAPAVGGQAVTGGIVLVVAYSIAAAAAFLAAGALHSLRPGWDGSVAGMAGLGRERPVLGVAIGVAMFSMIGMPLTAGFWGKLLVLGTAVSSGQWWLALIGVMASMVSFGYYGGVVRVMYFEAAPEDVVASGPAGPDASQIDAPAEVMAIVCALAVLAIGCIPLVAGIRPLMGLFALS